MKIVYWFCQGSRWKLPLFFFDFQLSRYLLRAWMEAHRSDVVSSSYEGLDVQCGIPATLTRRRNAVPSPRQVRIEPWPPAVQILADGSHSENHCATSYPSVTIGEILTNFQTTLCWGRLRRKAPVHPFPTSQQRKPTRHGTSQVSDAVLEL